MFAQALRELALREHLPYHPRVLAITGTNGKTTVTALTGQLLQRAGVRTAVAGNIGPALLDVLAQALDAETHAERAEAEQASALAVDSVMSAAPNDAGDGADAPISQAMADTLDAETGLEQPDDEGDAPLLVPPPAAPLLPPHLPAVWVLELSSFQLDGVSGGAWGALPTAATLLNDEDHLDWHGSMAAYSAAKAAVFGAQALMLLNRDDARVMAMQPANVTVKVGGRNRQQPARPWASFGLDAPTRVGDYGIEMVNGMAWLVRALDADETRRRRKDDVEEIYIQRLMPADALRIRGRHNALNALAALALAGSAGCSLAAMLFGLREYRGEPHRVESVGVAQDIEYFDDSKGTNVGATAAALVGLGAERRLVVILGGEGKGQDFTPLVDPVTPHARAVVLIGRDAPLRP